MSQASDMPKESEKDMILALDMTTGKDMKGGDMAKEVDMPLDEEMSVDKDMAMDEDMAKEVDMAQSEDATHFVTVWKVPQENPTVEIITQQNLQYKFDVDWDNDGTFDEFDATSTLKHTYPQAGEYTIRIRGQFPSFINAMPFSPNANKLVEVKQWGDIEWESMAAAFAQLSTLRALPSEAPDLSRVKSLSVLFDFSSGFNQDLGNWKTSSVEDMTRAFQATNFDFNLGSWDMSSVKEASGMLDNSSLSTANYDATLKGWSEQPSLQRNVNLGAMTLTYCKGEGARQKLIDDFGWNITGDKKNCL